ncbi:hypothetical protein AB1046_05265 [Promicromonospora sp. Populi]|uniref:hypothetical protein n=1 Tax=Promicromonospora sp. Populi TaxID=3239420 RepID=UPI0034E216A3
MSVVRRGVRAVVLALVLTVVTTLPAAAPASAHAGGLSPTEVRGAVVAVTPQVPGLTVSAIEDGARLLVRNNTGSTVEIPAGGGQDRPLSVPDGESVTWIDGRATTLERDLGEATTGTWSVPMTVGTVPVTVDGEFVAEPPPNALGWWALAAGIAAALIVLARRSRRPNVLLAVSGLVTVAVSLVHVIGATLAVESAPLWGTFLDATGIGLLVWPLVVVAAIAALRGSAAGVLGVCAGAGLSVVFVLPDLTVFHFAVLPVAGPATLERFLVALVLGAGVAAAVAGAGALRALAPRTEPDATQPMEHAPVQGTTPLTRRTRDTESGSRSDQSTDSPDVARRVSKPVQDTGFAQSESENS